MCREPEETRDAEAEEAAEEYAALPAPVGASETWAEAPAAGFGAVEGFEAAREYRWGGELGVAGLAMDSI